MPRGCGAGRIDPGCRLRFRYGQPAARAFCSRVYAWIHPPRLLAPCGEGRRGGLRHCADSGPSSPTDERPLSPTGGVQDCGLLRPQYIDAGPAGMRKQRPFADGWRKINVPTLDDAGDDDQIVLYVRSAKLLRHGTLKTIQRLSRRHAYNRGRDDQPRPAD
jgi:hypothetical protein